MQYKWFKIANLPSPGKPLIAQNTVASLSVNGRNLYLANLNGEYFAGEASCPHAGGAMDRGWLDENGYIVCPLHRFCFELNTGHNKNGEGFAIQTYPVREEEDGYYVGFPKIKWCLVSRKIRLLLLLSLSYSITSATTKILPPTKMISSEWA
ncbi:MAG: Rieske 2Fe-2S domain-containing protein [Sphingobacteriales bacterium]|nr:MAG: Rieske 2Fe-2S domain-containing protein [Sphingobacteriales bacterium]